jgi:hypothetical protein
MLSLASLIYLARPIFDPQAWEGEIGLLAMSLFFKRIVAGFKPQS